MSNIEHKTTEKEIKEIWERLTKGEASIKSAHHRIDNFEKIADSVSKMAISINNIAAETKALREDYIKADEKIENLREKPSKRFETFINATLSALAGGIVGYLLALIF
jgi:DNA repair ATPase RecN